MNPLLEKLQPYPFEKVRALIAGATPNSNLKPIDLSIGEPKHPTPALIKNALVGALDGLSVYPRTAGLPVLRQAIASWLARRYGIPAPDPDTQVLPANGAASSTVHHPSVPVRRRRGWAPTRRSWPTWTGARGHREPVQE